MSLRQRLAVPGALAVSWVFLAAVPPAALAGHPAEPVLGRLLVMAFAVSLLVEAWRALSLHERADVLRPRALARLTGTALACLLLLAWVGGAILRTSDAPHRSGWRAGSVHGPLTTWPHVEAWWGAGGIAVQASLGWLLMGMALAGLTSLLLVVAWERARSRGAGVAAAACSVALAAPACPSCLAPALAALALVGVPGVASMAPSSTGGFASIAMSALIVGAPLVALAVLARGSRRGSPPAPVGTPRAVWTAAAVGPLAFTPLFGAQLALFMPEGASPQFEAIRSLLLVASVVAALLFLPVVALALYYPWRYRDRGDSSPPRGRPLSPRARRVLIAAYTIVPGVLIVALGLVSAQILVETEAPPEGTLHVDVRAEQFNWTFVYPDGSITTNRLVVPVNEVVVLHVSSVDVVHSFYVPQLGVKIDALPNHENVVWFQATRPGEFQAQCAEFCGRYHTLMRATVVVRPAG